MDKLAEVANVTTRDLVSLFDWVDVEGLGGGGGGALGGTGIGIGYAQQLTGNPMHPLSPCRVTIRGPVPVRDAAGPSSSSPYKSYGPRARAPPAGMLLRAPRMQTLFLP